MFGSGRCPKEMHFTVGVLSLILFSLASKKSPVNSSSRNFKIFPVASRTWISS